MLWRKRRRHRRKSQSSKRPMVDSAVAVSEYLHSSLTLIITMLSYRVGPWFCEHHRGFNDGFAL